MKEYVNTRIENVKFNAAEKSSGVAANTIAGIVVGIVFLFFLTFLSIAGALALSDWIGASWSGFLIVAGIYLALGLGVWFGRQKLLRIPIMNSMIRQLFKNNRAHG